MIASMRQLMTMNTQQLWILFQAFILLPVTTIALKIFSFDRISSIITRQSLPQSTNFTDLDTAQMIAYLVYGVANKLPLNATCLARSLVLSYILKRYHITNEIVIGVQKTPEVTFSAHAWVQVNKSPLQQKVGIESEYTQLFTTANI